MRDLRILNEFRIAFIENVDIDDQNRANEGVFLIQRGITVYEIQAKRGKLWDFVHIEAFDVNNGQRKGRIETSEIEYLVSLFFDDGEVCLETKEFFEKAEDRGTVELWHNKEIEEKFCPDVLSADDFMILQMPGKIIEVDKNEVDTWICYSLSVFKRGNRVERFLTSEELERVIRAICAPNEKLLRYHKVTGSGDHFDRLWLPPKDFQWPEFENVRENSKRIFLTEN